MEKILEDGVKGRLDELKELYAQFFLLMGQSIGGITPGAIDLETATVLDEPIQRLMQAIGERQISFHKSLAKLAQSGESCSPDLKADIDEFTSKLEAGLGSTLGRVQQAIDAMGGQRDRVKDELSAIQGKKLGRRAYSQPANPVSTLLNSKV